MIGEHAPSPVRCGWSTAGLPCTPAACLPGCHNELGTWIPPGMCHLAIRCQESELADPPPSRQKRGHRLRQGSTVHGSSKLIRRL